MIQINKNIITGMLVAVFVAAIFLCLWSVSMAMSMNMSAENHCLVPGSGNHCMNSEERFASWQSTFIAIPIRDAALFIVLALSFFSLVMTGIRSARDEDEYSRPVALNIANKQRRVNIIDPILLAFSSGILQSKIITA